MSNWPGPVPLRAPGLEELSVLVELGDARVAVAVGDENVAGGVPGHVGGPIEIVAGDARAGSPRPPRSAATATAALATAAGASPTLIASGLRPMVIDDAAGGIELDDHAGTAIDHPDVVLRIDPTDCANRKP